MIEINETDLMNVGAAIERWQNFPASGISHHGEQCCHVAREWVLATDYSQLNGSPTLTGPRWLRQKFAWGPSRWPIYWCEAVREEKLDCGALAALSKEIFLARGVRSYTAQLIQQYSSEAICHWNKEWEAKECSVKWIEDGLIYHEGCAVVVGDGEIKLWDPTASWWVNPRHTSGYGGLLAVRVCTPPAEAETFVWGRHAVAANRWCEVSRAGAEAALAATA